MAINHFTLFVFLVFSATIANGSVRRLSQKEGNRKKSSSSVEDVPEASPLDYANENDQKSQKIVCGDGWLNFRDELCFLGIQEPQLPFAYGNQQCGKFGANYSSVHSMAEFQFIMENFDLHKFWIGVMYGADQYQDGTAVEQDVLHQFAPFVPWTDPNNSKGFVCRAFPINGLNKGGNGLLGQQSATALRRK